MKKIQLNNPKLGELRFPIEITDAPKFGFIVSASASSAYENGKAVEGQLSKINIGVVNFETAKLLTQIKSKNQRTNINNYILTT